MATYRRSAGRRLVRRPALVAFALSQRTSEAAEKGARMIGLSSTATWRLATRLVLLLVLGLSACAGIVYWALLGSLVGVLISAIVPGRLAMWAATGRS